jgi:hypothetical protein
MIEENMHVVTTLYTFWWSNLKPSEYRWALWYLTSCFVLQTLDALKIYIKTFYPNVFRPTWNTQWLWLNLNLYHHLTITNPLTSNYNGGISFTMSGYVTVFRQLWNSAIFNPGSRIKAGQLNGDRDHKKFRLDMGFIGKIPAVAWHRGKYSCL